MTNPQDLIKVNYGAMAEGGATLRQTMHKIDELIQNLVPDIKPLHQGWVAEGNGDAALEFDEYWKKLEYHVDGLKILVGILGNKVEEAGENSQANEKKIASGIRALRG